MTALIKNDKFKKFIALTMAFLMTYMCYCPMVFAANTVDTDKLVGRILGFIIKIFFYVGVILLLWAIGQLVFAFKNDDPDSKQKAAMLLVVAIILMGIKPVFDSLGLITIIES